MHLYSPKNSLFKFKLLYTTYMEEEKHLVKSFDIYEIAKLLEDTANVEWA